MLVWSATLSRPTMRHLACLLLTLCALPLQAMPLSPAQEARLTALRTATAAGAETDPAIIASWPPARQIAVLQCQPVVARELQQHYPWVDEVQLGEEGRPLALHDNTRLTGEGHLQLGGSWHSFSFDCLLDPATGTVSRVTYRMNH